MSDSSPLSTAPPSPASSEASFLSRTPSLPGSFIVDIPTPISDKSITLEALSKGVCDRLERSEDGEPPAKKRRVTVRKPRKQLHLDLTGQTLLSSQIPQLDILKNVLRKRRKIVVVAGAGISVSAGIPDFRSSTGLFSTLRNQHNLKASGKHLFDASVYRDDSTTSYFHEMVRELSHLSKKAEPTQFHHMLARLGQDGRLLRLYSQNVDGIDTSLPPLATNIPLNGKGPWPRTVQLHGGLEKMVCSKCHQVSEFNGALFDGPEPPSCDACEQMDLARTETGMRSHGIGKLRPRMVLYNEHNPDDEAIGSVTTADLRNRPDALIVVGTSLKVPGVRRIVREMCSVVRSRRDGITIWINTDSLPTGKDFENCWDLVIRGNSDRVADIAQLPNWDVPKTEDEDESAIEQQLATADAKLIEADTKRHVSAIKVVVPPGVGIPTPTGTPRAQSPKMTDRERQASPLLKKSTLSKKKQAILSETTRKATATVKQKQSSLLGATKVEGKAGKKKPRPKLGQKDKKPVGRPAKNPITQSFAVSKKGDKGAAAKLTAGKTDSSRSKNIITLPMKAIQQPQNSAHQSLKQPSTPSHASKLEDDNKSARIEEFKRSPKAPTLEHILNHD